jgi:hypothetical protein
MLLLELLRSSVGRRGVLVRLGLTLVPAARLVGLGMCCFLPRVARAVISRGSTLRGVPGALVAGALERLGIHRLVAVSHPRRREPP